MVRVEQQEQEQELKKGRGPRVDVIDKQRHTVENPRERERIPVKEARKGDQNVNLNWNSTLAKLIRVGVGFGVGQRADFLKS